MPKRKKPKGIQNEIDEQLKPKKLSDFVLDPISGEKFTPDEWQKITEFRNNIIKQRQSENDISMSTPRVKQQKQRQIKKMSQTTKDKIADSKRNKIKTTATKEQISKTLKGKKRTPETIEKQKQAQQERRARERQEKENYTLKIQQDFTRQYIANFIDFISNSGTDRNALHSIIEAIDTLIESDGEQKVAEMLQDFSQSEIFPDVLKGIHYKNADEKTAETQLFISTMVNYFDSNDLSTEQLDELNDYVLTYDDTI